MSIPPFVWPPIAGGSGTPGPPGPDGPMGPVGPTGATGATGAAGAQGSPGPEGQQGEPGQDGSPGVPGAAGAAGVGFDVTTSLPANWWRASTTVVSGGQVDTIIDSGSLLKNLGGVGADRCPLGTDGDGKLYLDLAADLYTAGVAADWKWLHDLTTDWTVAVVTSKPSWPGVSNVPLCLLATMSWTTALGFSLMAGVNGAGGSGVSGGSFWGWETIVCNGTNQYNLQINTAKATPAPTTKQVAVFRFCRQRIDAQYSGIGAANPMSFGFGNIGDAWQQGAFVARQAPAMSATANVGNPTGTLTMGSFTNGASRYTGRLYEIVTWQKRLSDVDVGLYSKDAASRYAFTL
jgi:hypothetical protein